MAALADDRIGLWADVDREVSGFLLVAEGGDHLDGGRSRVVVPLDVNLVRALSADDASGGARADGPGEHVAIRRPRSAQEIGGNLVGAGTVLVEGGGKHRVEHVEVQRRGGSTERGRGAESTQVQLVGGGRAHPVDCGAGSEGGGRCPGHGRDAPGVVDAGLNWIDEVQEILPRAALHRATDDWIGRICNHDGDRDVGVAIVGAGVGGRDDVGAGGREGDRVERTGEGSGSRGAHLPIEGNGGIGGKGQAGARAGGGGGGGEGQFRQDVHREAAFPRAVRRGMALQPAQEWAFIRHVQGPHTSGAPDDADLMAIRAGDRSARDSPIVFDVHPFGDGIHHDISWADDIRPGNGGGGGEDGDLHGGRLIADAIASRHGETDFAEGPLVPLETDFRSVLTGEGDVVPVGVSHHPVIGGSRAGGGGPIAGAVPFAQG